MNRLLTPLLLGLAVLGLAAAVIFKSYRSEVARDAIVECDPARVQSLRLHVAGESLEVRRKDGGWVVIAEDFRDAADRERAEQLVGAASQPPVSHHVPAREARGNLAEFGLRSPKRWIEIQEKRKWKVLLGKESAMEGLVYARREDAGDVYLVPREYAGLAEISADQLRFPKVSPVEPGNVDRFMIRAGAGEVELARTPQGWEFRRPLAAKADAAAVESLLGKILGAPVLGFEGKDSGDLGHLGVEPGRQEFVVYACGREKPLVIRFGKEVPGGEGQVFAQLTARDVVVRLPLSLKDRALGSAEELRDRSLLRVNLDMVDAIELRCAEKSLMLRRKGEGWEREGDSAHVEDSWPEELVQALADFRVREFIRTFPERAPDASVRFLALLSENTPEAEAGTQDVAAAEFWREDGVVIARIAGQSGAVTADPGLLDWLEARFPHLSAKEKSEGTGEKSLGDRPHEDNLSGP